MAVELGQGLEADIELAAVGIFCGVDFVGEAGHGDGAFVVFEADFCGKCVAGSTGAGGIGLPVAAGGVTGLDERAGEDAEEALAVVEFFCDEFFKILDGVGRGVVVEADGDLAWLLFLGELDLENGDIRAECGGAGGGGAEERGEREGDEGFHRIGNARRSTSPSGRPCSSLMPKRSRSSNWRLR